QTDQRVSQEYRERRVAALRRTGGSQGRRGRYPQRTWWTLHRFSRARSVGDELDGRRHVGRWIRHRRHAHPQTTQALSGHAHETKPFLDRGHGQPNAVHGSRSFVALDLRAVGFRRGHLRQLARLGRIDPARSTYVLRHWTVVGYARANTGNHFRLDEPLHAPHVDHVRNLFLRRPFPGGRSTLPANSAAPAFDRRHPQRHVGAGHLELTRLGTGYHADLERGELRRGLKVFSLGMSMCPSKTWR